MVGRKSELVENGKDDDDMFNIIDLFLSVEKN